MKFSIVISVLNQKPLARACFSKIFENIEFNEYETEFIEYETEFIIIDNGSDIAIDEAEFIPANVIRNEKNIGVYPTFKQGMEAAKGDIVAFFHSDVVIWEKGWNQRVIDTFINNPKLGLLGFIGSNEIDQAGGRGLGTISNFLGESLTDGVKTWSGSRWNIHGGNLTGYKKGAVVDGCVMILRREAWDFIGYRENFPPHHFYDRLISTQILEKNWDVGILGIGFDHISGQTV